MFQKTFRCALTILLASSFISAGWAQIEGSYAPDELLVKFDEGASGDANARSANAAAANAFVGAEKIKDFTLVGWQHVKLPKGKGVQAAIAQYKGLKGVVDAEPNYIAYAGAVPSDPDYNQLWGMTKTSAPAAWDITTGSASVVVAVVDSGVDYNHSDLAANMWRNPGESGSGKENNGLDDDGDGYIDDVFGMNAVADNGNPLDDNNHGTHVSGTIGAVANNGVGVNGVNWNVKIMALKFMDATNYGYYSDAIECYNYLIARRKSGVNVQLANNSWGGTTFSQALKDAYDAAGNAGILSVCAAMNDSKNNDTTASPSYPASFGSPSIVSVAASDESDNRASFSNWGATSVDLAAPGVNILSTTRGNTYSYFNGTSMAAPHVTGAAALVLSRGTVSVVDLKARLLNSVDILPQWAGLTVTGGRLNTNRFVNAPPVVALKARFFPRARYESSMVGGRFQGSYDNNTWTTLATLNRTPVAGAYSEIAMGSVRYRYLRYMSPTNVSTILAELEFYNGTAKLTGTTFGTAGSWNNLGNTYVKAFDGNVTTFFEAPTTAGSYTGIDIGP